MARWHSLWMIASTPALEDELNIERLLAVARHQPVSAAAHALVSIAVAVVAGTTSQFPILLVLAAFQILALTQASVWWRHRHDPRPVRVTSATIRRIIVTALMWGLLWGTFTATLLASADDTARDAIVIAIIGMSAGGAAMLATIPAATAAFLCCTILPPAVVALSWGTEAGHILGSFLILGLIFLGLSARRSFMVAVDQVQIRLDLAQLAKEAEVANKTKARFLANMGHELRTPLNAIIGFGEMIGGEMKGPVGSRAYIDFAGAIVQSGRELLGVIDDVLELSRFELGLSQPQERDIAVTRLVAIACDAVRALCDKSAVHLIAEVNPDLPLLQVDPDQLHQVLVGLLSNAIKFSPREGRIRLEAKLAPHPYGLTALLLRVSDQGPGIPASELSQILRPFVWTREAELHPVPGSGLKLPLINQIVRAHGGRLDITSIEGRGTSVTIALPPERFLAYPAAMNPMPHVPSVVPSPCD